MNITSFSVRYGRAIFGIIVSFGIAALLLIQNIPREDMPPFLVRNAKVTTYFPGGSPERIELLITDKLEKAIQEIPEVEYIRSESSMGVSEINVVLKENIEELESVWIKLRQKVKDTKSKLPHGIIGPKVDDERGHIFSIMVGIWGGQGYSYAELKKKADEVRNAFYKIPQTAKVEIVGEQEERIFIEYSNVRLSEIGFSKEKLQEVISSSNIISPGGFVNVGDERVILEPSGNFESLEDLKKLIFPTANAKEFIYLEDIAHIYKGYIDPEEYIVRVNGQKGLAVAVSMKRGENIIELGEAIDKQIKYFNDVLPLGIHLQKISSGDRLVQRSINTFLKSLSQSIIAVLLIMLVVMGARAGLVVAAMIPLSIMVTLVFMSIFGIGLNQVTLASLIIVLGMLVDNAIVMSDSIATKFQEKVPPMRAAYQSAHELSGPLLTASLTTSAAFLCFFLANSVMGEIFGETFLVVTIALISSWLLSQSVVPILMVYFVKAKTKSSKSRVWEIERILKRRYVATLNVVLSSPYKFLLLMIILLLFAALISSFIPFIFFPESSRQRTVVASFQLPHGIKIKKTEEVIGEIEEFILDSLMVGENRKKGVLRFSSFIGGGAPKYDPGYMPEERSPEIAHLLIITSGEKVNKEIIRKIRQYSFDNFPNLVSRISLLSSSGKSKPPIEVRISGEDTDTLFSIVKSLKTKLDQIKGAREVSDDWGLKTKKLIVRVDQARARLAGVTNLDVALSLETLTGSPTGEFRDKNLVIPIITRNIRSRRNDISSLEGLNIFSKVSKKTIPLKSVAEIEPVWQYAKILRRDLYKTITVRCELLPGYNATNINEKFLPWLKKESKKWGPRYFYEIGGEKEESKKGIGSITSKLWISICVIVILLFIQFNSVRKTLILLVTIPTGLVGVVFGLFLTGSYFGFFSFLGMIALGGIVINNGIVLLERIEIEMEEFNRTSQNAILAASRKRIRPILLTTITTTLGLLPLWISGGFWGPMAITLIFGLIFGTFLTLYLVPILYKLAFKIE
ncbi:efflux RND transporter permease subunit [Xanthovirga aplysinae]|uniref:efflux RND transporter permease subunit n=1 Tax=Xanthovirga aplysinae TaxID=2529853 RepID=UPI0012BB7498|nr:efflux RND transporter permease subunit [Xanthovirga aplysinae]MTI32473.1 efflux RND transporter permease subunit [Xanthovirga aplysinae]